MIIYEMIATLCFVVAIFHALVVGLSLILKKGAERKRYLRNFKKGNCIIIYVISVPLCFIGRIYADSGNVIESVFGSVNHVLNLMVLRYDVSAMAKLMQASAIYAFTIHTVYVLVFANATAFTLSIFCQGIWQFICSLKYKFGGNKKVFFIGSNQNTYKLYKTCTNGEKTLLLLKDLQSETKYDKKEKTYNLYEAGINFVFENTEKAVERIIKFARVMSVSVVINTNDEKNNVLLCKKIVSALNILTEQDRNIVLHNLKVFVYGDSTLVNVYKDIVEESFGSIIYVNQYQKIAMELVEKYPFSAFMNANQINYEKATLNKDVNVNVCIFGFGKTGSQLFLTSVANNQFITEENGEIVTKAVNYHVFDKNEKFSDGYLNHGFFRYEQELKEINESDYYPLPDRCANCFYHGYESNDVKTYVDLKQILTLNKLDSNFIVICFGSDYENIDFAQKLLEKGREWNVENLNVFVKSDLVQKSDTFIEEQNCYFFGNKQQISYDYNNLLNDNAHVMAKLRNYSYLLESKFASCKPTQKQLEELKNQAGEKWFLQSQNERESSLYCVLSLKQKLNLMNLDVVNMNDPRAKISETEFFDSYAKDYPVVFDKTECADGKKKVIYDFDFKKSLRTNFAILEHSRWNAFMISKGFIPSTKEQILGEKNSSGKFTNGKNYSYRRHGNITTFSGLMQFANDVAKRDGVSWQEKDVIRYDYQIMDDAYWLCEKANLKIVKKN